MYVSKCIQLCFQLRSLVNICLEVQDILRDHEGDDTQLISASIMYDVWHSAMTAPLSCQQPHCDFRQTGLRVDFLHNKVSITALSGPFRLLVWPGVHKLLENLFDYHGGYFDTNGVRNPGFVALSDQERDNMFCALCLNNVPSGGLQPALFTMQGMLSMYDTLIDFIHYVYSSNMVTWLAEGETVWLKQHFPHAGMPGIITEDGMGVHPSYRLHFYYIPKGGDPSSIQDMNGHITSPLSCLALGMVSSTFAEMFWDGSHQVK